MTVLITSAQDPPPNSLIVMETELELLRAELAWLNQDGRRILQCFGGLGGLIESDTNTVELVPEGK